MSASDRREEVQKMVLETLSEANDWITSREIFTRLGNRCSKGEATGAMIRLRHRHLIAYDQQFDYSVNSTLPPVLHLYSITQEGEAHLQSLRQALKEEDE